MDCPAGNSPTPDGGEKALPSTTAPAVHEDNVSQRVRQRQEASRSRARKEAELQVLITDQFVSG